MAGKVINSLNDLKEKVETYHQLDKKLKDLKERWQILDKEPAKIKDLEIDFLKFKKEFQRAWLEFVMAGSYDKNDALLSIYSGAGGRDAQDWAAMLLRMYEKYAGSQGWQYKILHQHFGESGGIKNVTIEIKGRYAYGYLKNESGVHRLVRISPFSAQKLRHTSFALCEILPIIEIPQGFKIDPKDLKIDTHRSSGPGGQNVNKRETAVRITHLPTGIQVVSQSERSQLQNKEKAMQILYARLFKLMEEQKAKEISELRAEKREPEWGSQIRSYVLHPYKMVKDHRTGIEISQVEEVLDGKLDKFIEAEINLK